MQSPAAYPEEAEIVPYGSRFSEIVHSEWDVSTSPVFNDLKEAVQRGSHLLISYFQKDDPPIPSNIQAAYLDLLASMLVDGLPVIAYTIYGVEHNFRRIGSDHGDNIVNNDSIRGVAQILAEFIDVQ